MQIRPVEREEWEALHALRLEALPDSPDAFGSSHELEVALPAEEWQWWISGEGGMRPGAATTFVADEDGFQGMATGAMFDAEPERAHLFGMWVRPSAREHGLGLQLLEAVAAWTREARCARAGTPGHERQLARDAGLRSSRVHAERGAIAVT